MKKSLLYIGVLCLAISSCKDDAELNDIIPYQFSPTSVEIAPQSVTLKAEILTEQTIQEKGFILERTYKSNFNYDNSSMDTIALAVDAPFECTITSDMEKGQPCTAFAYIKQNGHYYRNEEATFVPEGCMPPSITSIISGYDKKTGKYLHIKGENFSRVKNRNNIYHGDYLFIDHQVIQASSTELLIAHGFTESGKTHSITLHVGDNHSEPANFILAGPSITSWAPEYPRFGEKLTIYIKDFDKNCDIDLSVNNYTGEIGDNYISLMYLQNAPETSIGIRFRYPEYYISTGTIKTSIPWYKKGQRCETNHRTYNYINGKLYMDDYRDISGLSTLRCYDFDTDEWTEYPYEPLAYTPQSQMWHSDKYIYLLHTFNNEWNPTEIKELKRFNLENHKWEKMEEAPLSTTTRGVCCTGEYAYVYYEKECYQYSNTNDVWKKIDGTIRPTICEIGGHYGSYTYYLTSSGDLYRIKTGETGEAEFVVKCTTNWEFLNYSIRLIGQNLYFSTNDKGIMKYDLKTNTFKHLGIPENGMEYSHVYTNYSFIEKDNELYILGGSTPDFHQYIEDREE